MYFKEIRDNYTHGAIHLALSSSLRASNKRSVATAVDTVMKNQESEALSKVPKFIKNFDVQPEPFCFDECTAIVLYNHLSADVYKRLTQSVNEKVKKLDWKLEKFRVNCCFC